jgi:acyl carrier protein
MPEKQPITRIFGSMLVNAESILRMRDENAGVMKSSRQKPRGRISATAINADRDMSIIELSSTERVAAVVRRLLADRSITRSFTATEDLRDVGLTSLDMVNLVLAVEAELSVSVPEAEITPANFRSVATIEALVEGLRHRSAA